MVVVVWSFLPIIESPQLTLFNSVLDWVGLYEKVIKRWWWCGGGVIYLIDYRTTPVNIVQLCTGLGCGNNQDQFKHVYYPVLCLECEKVRAGIHK